MSLKNKLNRLKPHLSAGRPPAEQVTAPLPVDPKLPFMEEWEDAGVKAYHFDGQFCLIREVRYPLSHRHGKYCFSDFIEAAALWEKSGIDHPLSSAGNKPDDLFFFDTETTGLGGGTGNTIFLLGYASIKDDSLLLRQHILPHPGAEVPLYHSFLENIDYQTLVTYNGKSFDWPQVKTRHTLVRENVPKLPEFGHFDLYHAARRLWKHKLERLKLSVVEKEVLGVERVDDIPGFLAPMIYFDFVESGRPEGMLGIMKHNELDILSLVTLYSHLTFQICGTDKERTEREAFEVGKWFSSVGNHTEAEHAFKGLIESDGEEAARSKLALAYSLKKQQNWEKALELFCSVAESDNQRETLVAEGCIEAAKILEHREKVYDRALFYCQKALGLADIDEIKLSSGMIRFEDILHREERLKRKVNGKKKG
ncbi:ribonuclease H-like domain-containing protein [Bacillus sp. FJAT-27445]|uniref:ribonuclease H-like domain-containing protein n=1 Tax=Bacillus sp. FJAT-27445 TaxID=1679166 RepID=UPI0007435E3C|nr:ribonuclease H-like domain-containing protein [Bacillus sp. FJAT-27445]